MPYILVSPIFLTWQHFFSKKDNFRICFVDEGVTFNCSNLFLKDKNGTFKRYYNSTLHFALYKINLQTFLISFYVQK